MWPNSIANAVLVPVGGIHVVRREPGVIEWITEVSAHPDGFGFLVKRHWWSRDEKANTEPTSDAVVDLASASPDDLSASSIWSAEAGGESEGATTAASGPRSMMTRTLVRSLLPPFEITVTLPSGRSEAISEPMSTDEYVGRWESPEYMLATNDPAGTLRSGWNRERQVGDDGSLSVWEHHEVEITIWCDQLPESGDVRVAVSFDGDARDVVLDGAAIKQAAEASVPLFEYEGGTAEG